MDISGDGPLNVVQLEALTLVKIVKHCSSSLPNLVTGQLLGLDVAGTLEVTNCFPFPAAKEDEESDERSLEAGAAYQNDMMRCLREVNVDNNAVGWYQSAFFGSYLEQSVIESQFTYQSNIAKSVVIIYDPRGANGAMSLRAYRLTKKFMDVYRDKKFTSESLIKSNLSFNSIFEEVPISVRNGPLVNALLYDLAGTFKSPLVEQLSVVNNIYLERNVEFMIESVDNMVMEQYKQQSHLKTVARNQQLQQQYLAKRKAEIAQRAANGDEPLPEEDLSQNPLFKPVPESSKLDSLLITSQIDSYCKQVNQFAGQMFPKLFLSYEM